MWITGENRQPERDFVSNIEECTPMETDIQKHATVLANSEHVIG